MKNFCFALCLALLASIDQALGSEAGMPQLNPEFWAAQVFWLLLIFLSLYLIIWKIFLPKITYNIETRKSKIVNDLHEAQKLKENAEIKLKEYDKIIENSQKEAKKIIEDGKKVLDKEIESKKQKFNNEIEKDITVNAFKTKLCSLKISGTIAPYHLSFSQTKLENTKKLSKIPIEILGSKRVIDARKDKLKAAAISNYTFTQK